MTGCPALLLPSHVTDASGPASGWLPLGQQLEQQIKLWRKEGEDVIHRQPSHGRGGGSSCINM